MIERLKLHELLNLRLSTRQIAAEIGLTQTTVRYWLKKYDLNLNSSKGGKQKSLPIKLCLNCFNCLQNKSSQTNYFSLQCTAQHQQKICIKMWLSGDISGCILGGTLISYHIRNYLLAEAKYQCSEGKWSEVNLFTNKIPLEINHIDGNFLNNSPDNLEFFCPNCHALKHTYQIRSKGRRSQGNMK